MGKTQLKRAGMMLGDSKIEMAGIGYKMGKKHKKEPKGKRKA